jgi:glycosyltransferase involved in cell wall biosynthesis
MACGVACIASKVGGIPEILDGGSAGILFDPGDEIQLANGLKALLGSQIMREALGAAARKRICANYSMEIMLNRYRMLYQQFAAQPAYA